jgi:hypothetical protein
MPYQLCQPQEADMAFNTDDNRIPVTGRVHFERVIEIDEFPDLSWLEPDSGRYADVEDAEERERYQAQDAERLAAYYAGAWEMTGVRAKVTMHVPIGGNSFAVYTLTSPGLWGVESDADENYLAEVYREQCAELAQAVWQMGQMMRPTLEATVGGDGA